MRTLLQRLSRRSLRLDRSIESPDGEGSVFDLDVVHRGFKESLLVARLFRRPARYVRGRRDR